MTIEQVQTITGQDLAYAAQQDSTKNVFIYVPCTRVRGYGLQGYQVLLSDSQSLGCPYSPNTAGGTICRHAPRARLMVMCGSVPGRAGTGLPWVILRGVRLAIVGISFPLQSAAAHHLLRGSQPVRARRVCLLQTIRARLDRAIGPRTRLSREITRSANPERTCVAPRGLGDSENYLCLCCKAKLTNGFNNWLWWYFELVMSRKAVLIETCSIKGTEHVCPVSTLP